MAFERLKYGKSWEDPTDFPTYEDSEAQVRADLQYHPDAVRDFINEKLIAALEGPEGAASLGVTGTAQGSKTLQAVLDEYMARFERVDDDIRLVAAGGQPGTGTAVSSYYRLFEAEDWKDGALRIPRAEHGMRPSRTVCAYTLRMRVGRSARDYLDETYLGEVRSALIAAEEAALAANAAVPGTFPADGVDGHIPMSWEQFQYYLLEGVLASAEDAAAAAAAKGFDWKDRDTLGVGESVSLDELLTAAYLPAMGGPAAQLDALFSLEAVQGLRLRRRQEDVPTQAGTLDRYDLDGALVQTWGTRESSVRWDLDTGELVVEADAPYPGEVLVLG